MRTPASLPHDCPLHSTGLKRCREEGSGKRDGDLGGMGILASDEQATGGGFGGGLGVLTRYETRRIKIISVTLEREWPSFRSLAVHHKIQPSARGPLPRVALSPSANRRTRRFSLTTGVTHDPRSSWLVADRGLLGGGSARRRPRRSGTGRDRPRQSHVRPRRADRVGQRDHRGVAHGRRHRRGRSVHVVRAGGSRARAGRRRSLPGGRLQAEQQVDQADPGRAGGRRRPHLRRESARSGRGDRRAAGDRSGEGAVRGLPRRRRRHAGTGRQPAHADPGEGAGRGHRVRQRAAGRAARRAAARRDVAERLRSRAGPALHRGRHHHQRRAAGHQP